MTIDEIKAFGAPWPAAEVQISVQKKIARLVFLVRACARSAGGDCRPGRLTESKPMRINRGRESTQEFALEQRRRLGPGLRSSLIVTGIGKKNRAFNDLGRR